VNTGLVTICLIAPTAALWFSVTGRRLFHQMIAERIRDDALQAEVMAQIPLTYKCLMNTLETSLACLWNKQKK